MHQKRKHYVDVSKNRGTPKSSILKGFFIINHPFWGPTPIFGNIHILMLTSIVFGNPKKKDVFWKALVVEKTSQILHGWSVPGDQVLFARAIFLIWMTKRVKPIAWISPGAPFVAFQEAVTSAESNLWASYWCACFQCPAGWSYCLQLRNKMLQ